MTHTPNESLSANAENLNNSHSDSNQIIQKTDVPDTPFTIVKYDEVYFLTIGKYRLTEPMKTFEEVQADALRADWTRVLQVIHAMISTFYEEKELQKNQQITKTN